ncbi:hypothetical protein GIB67_018584 [Kingdonia uniflora]|uniref:CCHC-type domain-containing protein n=1 Tax=Kingdonia uniflora TaxID=39325 RepID=A0A7J7L8D5_9MAGN|nr:hypothetical protein GIB67_018584 [Kingdonia uniflora]
MGGGKHQFLTNVELFPICDQAGHNVSSCSWIYSKCKWLSDAINEFKNPTSSSSLVGCYGCGGLNHWVRECPWTLSNCKRLGCNDVIKLFTSTKASSYGLKFLKCQNVQCGKFMWLKDAIDVDEKVKEEERKKVVQNVKITLEMNIDDFIRDFKGKTTL